MVDADKGKKSFFQNCAQCTLRRKGGKHKAGPNLHGMFGEREVRLLDSSTQMPTRAKASPGERVTRWSTWRISKSTSLGQKKKISFLELRKERRQT